jgi:hypothetical protein
MTIKELENRVSLLTAAVGLLLQHIARDGVLGRRLVEATTAAREYDRALLVACDEVQEDARRAQEIWARIAALNEKGDDDAP